MKIKIFKSIYFLVILRLKALILNYLKRQEKVRLREWYEVIVLA